MTKTVLPKLTIARLDKGYSFSTPISWGMKDPDRFQELMNEAITLAGTGYYQGDNFFTWLRNISPMEDRVFHEAWQSNIQNPADEAIMWRRYILCCAAYHCVHLDGDFVECGTLFGTGIKTVVDYFGRDRFGKTFWGYDTFDTNPVEGHAFDGQSEGLFERVKERFAGYDNVRLVKGFLPDSLVGNSPERIAFMHIDLNSAEFEMAVLKVLFERMVPGGILVLDDYEWSGIYRQQKIEEDTWFDAQHYRVFPLPTGQGLVIKRGNMSLPSADSGVRNRTYKPGLWLFLSKLFARMAER